MSPLIKNKTTERNNILRYCFLAGALAALIMVFTYLIHQQSLFLGDGTVLRMDLYHQYGPLYAELYDRIIHGYSLVYSWTSGLGGSFIGNLFNYCCSPFALIIFFFGHKNMPEAIAVMILCKAVISSVTFTYYLNKSMKKTHLISAAFGVLYAFCGFFVAYSWNIMWLDAMSVFPLVILGVERIVEKRRPALFVFSLTFTMITNYYMAFMVCILSTIYFLYYYFGRYSIGALLRAPKPAPQPAAPEAPAAEPSVPAAEPAETAPSVLPAADADAQTAAGTSLLRRKPDKAKKPKKTRAKPWNRRFLVSGGIFAFSGLLCFFLAAFALVPVFVCLQSSSATSSKFPEDSQVYFNFFDFIANHLPAVEPTIRSSGENILPNVYCGLLTVFLLPFYFLSDRIPGRQKIVSVIFLGIFYVSFSVNYFNYIWHGLHFPNDLPYRFSFAYSFILLTLAYRAILHLREFSRRHFVVAGFALMLFVVFVDKVGSKNVDRFSEIISFIFCVIYVVIAGLMTSPRYTKVSLSKLLIFTVVMELCFANTAKYVMQQSKSHYTGDYNDYREISELVEKTDSELFYRTELSRLRARMDPCWYGYHGVSTFSSMAYEKTSAAMRKIGFFGNNINSYTYYPQTPIINSMFSIRYIYDNDNLISEGEAYSYLRENDSFKAYRYNYYLPLAFSVSRDIKNWDLVDSDPFAVQNDLMARAAGVDGILERVDATDFTSENLNDLSLDYMNDNNVFTVYKQTESETAQLKMLIDVETDGNYYVYFGSQKLSSIHIIADDFDYNYATSGIDPFIIDVGPLKKGDQISVEYNIDDTSSYTNISFGAAKLNLSAFRNAYKQIERNGTIEYTEFKDTHFDGTINVTNNNGFVFTSIPYDKSWEITVDGEKLEYATEEEAESGDTDGKIIAVGDGFLGFDIEKGEHTLAFRYKARGLSTGIAMTGIGIAVLCILLVLLRGRRMRLRAKAEAANGAVRQESPAASVPSGADEPAFQAAAEELPPADAPLPAAGTETEPAPADAVPSADAPARADETDAPAPDAASVKSEAEAAQTGQTPPAPEQV